MAVHTISLTDTMRGRVIRRIQWDDGAGTVQGDHSAVPLLQAALADGPPWTFEAAPHCPRYELADARHDPGDFLALLRIVVVDMSAGGADVALPPILRAATATPPVPEPPPPPGAVY